MTTIYIITAIIIVFLLLFVFAAVRIGAHYDRDMERLYQEQVEAYHARTDADRP